MYEGKEVDIFIPSMKVGIEYDGRFFHTEETQERDNSKDKFFKKFGIRLIRVKEYVGNIGEEKKDLIWINERKKQDSNIKYALKRIFELLELKDYQIDLDINRDRIEIMTQYYVSIQKNSFVQYHPELIDEWDDEKNDKLKMEMFSVGSGVKVWWKCDKGHSYSMSFDSRNKGGGCPICAGQKLLEGFNDLKTRYPEIAKEWCYKKNDNLMPQQFMPGSNIKVWWTCKNNHTYKATIASRTIVQSGCPYCSGRKAISGVNDLCTKYPWIKERWDFEKNIQINPKLQLPYTHKKIWWKCTKGHSFYLEVSKITSYYDKHKIFRCPVCEGSNKRKVINIDTNEVFESLEDAARACGLKKGDTISLCCQGKQKKAGGYHWKYFCDNE